MKISTLNIDNLRNHDTTAINCSPGLNILYGLNGSGKTTVLEAISILGFTKSFLPVHDASLVTYGKDYYQTGISAVNELGIPYRISIKYSAGSKKLISSSLGDNLSPKDVIGEMPLVILSPDFKSITFGSPQDRREFIDRLLSQSSKIYLEELIKYKKILKQRNNLLSTARTSKFADFSMIDPWTDLLIKTGAEIVVRRSKFIKEFIPFFNEVYADVSSGREEVSLEYSPNKIPEITEDRAGVERIYYDIYQQLKFDELRRGLTLFGPQKDDLKIFINSGIAREHASQGQHKSLLISIKFAEFNYLKARKDETPIILLDDIFSELDNERASKVFELVVRNNAQTFVTVTDISNMKGLIPETSESTFFKVSSGSVKNIDEDINNS